MTFADWVSSTLATTFLIGILGFILRHWITERIKGSIKHEYDKDLENHKANLKRDYDVQIETLKADFAKNHLRFSHTFERIAETLVKSYRMLTELRYAVDEYIAKVNRGEEGIEIVKPINEKSSEFFNYFVVNKIYVPKATADKVHEFYHVLQSYVRHFNMTAAMERSGVKYPKSLEHSYQKLDTLAESVPRLLNALEKDFQRVIGVDEEKN
jgi:hypothetical protein